MENHSEIIHFFSFRRLSYLDTTEGDCIDYFGTVLS